MMTLEEHERQIKKLKLELKQAKEDAMKKQEFYDPLPPVADDYDQYVLRCKSRNVEPVARKVWDRHQRFCDFFRSDEIDQLIEAIDYAKRENVDGFTQTVFTGGDIFITVEKR